MNAQPERQRIVERMAAAVEPLLASGDPLAVADAALRSLESPASAGTESMTPCTCGHSGYSKDGPHKPGCPLAD